MKYIIGTRGSKLALIQANYVCATLQERYPEHEFDIQIITTKGDVICDRPLNQIGDKGLFVNEIEKKIISNEIQIGVHSMKDMPATTAKGLVFTKSWKREDPRDALVLREKHSLEELPYGSVIATGSIRREVQLRKLRPDLKIIDIRGNVDTRLRKMEEYKLDGIVLAAAGLHRLGLKERITHYFDSDQMISAPAQGILALEVREDAIEIIKMLDVLSDEETNEITKAERGFLARIGGDCHVPIGAVCTKKADGQYELRAMVGDEEGKKLGYAVVTGADTEQLAIEAVRSIYTQLAGKVYLVGGGPGDPSLITVKGLTAIREADCIIYDRLSSPILLEEAKKDCELIYVGKTKHNHTMKQESINELLVKKAIEHNKVVRLKGGDAYVFGRGGEEGITLHENGIPFEIIPGISSSIAGLAYAGIPITHRGIAGGFHVVTAHNQKDELADIDFEAMARGKDTCVFLMGLSKLAEITERLIRAGMAAETPVAVISQATTPRQKTCVADLSYIVDEVKKAELVSPALIVVGNVVKLRSQLNFFESEQMASQISEYVQDKKYLVPKIGDKTTKLTRALRERGAIVDEVQVGTIVRKQVRFTKEELAQVDWMVFTSRNGVEAFFVNLQESGLDARSMGACKIAAIGEKTKECLLQYGILTDLVPAEYHSDALQQALCEQINGSDRVWYLKAENADQHLKEALVGHCKLEEIVVYENKSISLEDECVKNIDAYDGILFTCASSANRLFAGMEEEQRSKFRKHSCIYSIGPKTTEYLRGYGFDMVIEATEATYEALMECVIKR